MNSEEPSQPEGELPGTIHSQPPQRSFSLSALLLLVVTFAVLFGFIQKVFSDRSPAPASNSFVNNFSFHDSLAIKVLAAGVIGVLGLFVGAWQGWKLRKQISAALIGMFFGFVAAMFTAMILIAPPNWIMLCFGSGLLIGTAYLLRLGQRRQVSSAETNVPE